jgi:flagellar motor switch protein FliG
MDNNFPKPKENQREITFTEDESRILSKIAAVTAAPLSYDIRDENQRQLKLESLWRQLESVHSRIVSSFSDPTTGETYKRPISLSKRNPETIDELKTRVYKQIAELSGSPAKSYQETTLIFAWAELEAANDNQTIQTVEIDGKEYRRPNFPTPDNPFVKSKNRK